MPFTLAHAAAALPFRRFRLVPSALVVGTFAPDFEYFLRLAPSGGFGHTLRGAFVLTLPLAVVVLWTFHAFVKEPLTSLLPNDLQRKLKIHLDQFRFFGPKRLAWIVFSLLLGIATHILWDSFTHSTSWLYQHWLVLGQTLRLPIMGPVPYYTMFQHGSTIVGIGMLWVWFVHWYRTAQPCSPSDFRPLTSPEKVTRVALIVVIAFLGAVARAVAGVGVPVGATIFRTFVGEAVVTFVALMWWELVVYGIFSSMRPSSKTEVSV
jgi:hypothetical protein